MNDSPEQPSGPQGPGPQKLSDKVWWLAALAPLAVLVWGLSTAPRAPVFDWGEAPSDTTESGWGLSEQDVAWLWRDRLTNQPRWERIGRRDFADPWSQFDHSRNHEKQHVEHISGLRGHNTSAVWMLYDRGRRMHWPGAQSLRMAPEPLKPRVH